MSNIFYHISYPFKIVKTKTGLSGLFGFSGLFSFFGLFGFSGLFSFFGLFSLFGLSGLYGLSGDMIHCVNGRKSYAVGLMLPQPQDKSERFALQSMGHYVSGSVRENCLFG